MYYYNNDKHGLTINEHAMSPEQVETSQVHNPPKKRGISAGVIALSLSIALFGGLAGGAAAGLYFNRRENSQPVSNTSFSETSGSPKTGTEQSASSLSNGPANSINSIYENYKSAVVGIRNDGTTTNIFRQESSMASSGTGFIISSDGYILTNNHVVENAKKLTVTLNNGTDFTAAVVGADAENDVALIKINETGLNTVKLGNSDTIEVGETIAAIGNPLGELTYTVTAGIVSAEDRDINENGIPISMFQIDAAINPGNSGGPVFNLNGEVIGISTAKYASGEVEGIGFAIPINDAVKIADQLKATGSVKTRPYLGVSVTDASAQPDSRQSSGAYVAGVDPNGGAVKAGIKEGDIITAINGKTIKTAPQLMTALKELAAGNTVSVTIMRNGSSMSLTVTLTENKPNV